MAAAGAPQAGLAEAADTAARNLELSLMTSGLERAEGDACTLCYLYMGFPISQHSKMSFCCMKRLCDGCILAARQRGMLVTCPFCRTPVPADDASG